MESASNSAYQPACRQDIERQISELERPPKADVQKGNSPAGSGSASSFFTSGFFAVPWTLLAST